MLKKENIEKKKSLTFKQSLISKNVKVKKYTLQSLLVLMLAIILSVSYSMVFDTPEESALKLENAKYLKNLSSIQKDMDSVNVALSRIQQKDEHIYRQLLGVDPLDKDIRKAGIGGFSEESNSDDLPDNLKFGKYRKEIIQLNAKLKVQSVSFNELTTLATENVDRIQHRPSIYPIAPIDLIRLASGFGYRTHPIFHIRKFHKGIDLAALKGSPIYATAKGRVNIASNAHDGYGNKVSIDHGYGYKTVYAHLNKIKVKVGQQVNLGDLIGEVGNTGTSDGPHLHYEVRVNDRSVNPLGYIFKDISEPEYMLITQR